MRFWHHPFANPYFGYPPFGGYVYPPVVDYGYYGYMPYWPVVY